MPLTLEILRTTAALKALTPEWLALWHRAGITTPFQHPAWLLPWWHSFGQPDLRALTLREPDGTLAGLLPLYVYPDPSSGERQLLIAGAGTSDYLGGTFSPAVTPDDLCRALQHLFTEGGWDVAHLTQLLPESLLQQAVLRLSGWQVTPYPGESCSYCPAAAIADLPAKVRSKVRYYRNAAIGQGALELTVADEGNWPEAFEALVHFHTERWQQLGESGVLADPAVLTMHHQALPGLLAAGLLRLCTLRLGGETIGVLYALAAPPPDPPTAPPLPDPRAADRTLYLYLMGFSLEHAALQPGTLLTALTVEHAAREGFTRIDMLRGREMYKQFWHVQPIATQGFAIRPA